MKYLRTVKAVPTLVKVGFSEAIAYRAEMLVWVLGTTMPFVMMALWTAVSRYRPVVSAGGTSYGEKQFVTYFLSVFIVRSMISAWAAWEINFEVRQGTLSMKLLRPIHPIVTYAASNLAAFPLRIVTSLPIVAVLVFTGAHRQMQNDWRVWVLFPVSIAGGWAITYFVNVAIGSVSFLTQSSLKIMDVWLAMFFVFSGYLFPLDLFPPWLKFIAQWLPFRFQIGTPVALMTGTVDFSGALVLVAQQWMWAGALLVLAATLWNIGVKRYSAVGG